jgi:transcriptional regulator GlxA family with amidase domain
MPDSRYAIGAVLYPGFEMLDLFGPLEMFSILGPEQVVIHTLAASAGPVPAALGTSPDQGPQVVASYAFSDAPPVKLVLVPGGVGSVAALEDEQLLAFLRSCAERGCIIASVCTGSAVLARSGVLDGHRATSNKQVFALARRQSDQVQWEEAARWVEDGDRWTSSGVSAGMDMSIALIRKLFGPDAAEWVCRGAEYRAQASSEDDPFIEDLDLLSRQLGLA